MAMCVATMCLNSAGQPVTFTVETVAPFAPAAAVIVIATFAGIICRVMAAPWSTATWDRTAA